VDQLSGKVAVVTGGASGIGYAMAQRFGAEGMAVVLADVEETALEAAAKTLREAGGEVLAVPTDVTDPTAVDALERAARAHFGSYHVVCNNAGVGGHFGRTWETPLAEWKWILDVNLWGVIHGVHAFVPALVAQDEGHVVNTASLAAWLAAPSMGPYCTSKHAVLAISDALRAELAASGSRVGVSVVCPGMINTGIMSSERNWPARLGPEPARLDDDVTRSMRDMLLTGTTTGGLDPVAVADAVVASVKADRFVATTHPDEVVAAAETRLAFAREAAGVGGS